MDPRERSERGRAAALLLLAAAASPAPAASPGPAEPPEAAEDAAGTFQWRSTYAEGLAAAQRRSRPLLVYLPPVKEADEPAVMKRFAQLAGAPPLVEGVRAGADEVLLFMERFHVKKVPAVVLLDRRENVVAGWEGGVPPDLWSRIQAAVRKLDRRDEEDAKLLADARRTAAGGNLEGAYRKALPLLESGRTAPEAIDGARRIEAELLASLRVSLLRVVAGEGLRPDDDLRKDLDAIRRGTAHAAFQVEVGREIARLKVTTIGAR